MPDHPLIALEATLNDDVIIALKAVLGGLEEEEDQYRRRAYTRAVFAYVEGMTYIVKQNCLMIHERGGYAFSTAELSLLREETYNVDEQGRTVTRSRFVKLARNARFAFSIFLKCSRVTGVNLDFGGRGWSAFLSAIKIRHRVTHPKTTGAVDLTVEELFTVHTAFEWFQDALGKVFNPITGELKKSIEMERALNERFSKKLAEVTDEELRRRD